MARRNINAHEDLAFGPVADGSPGELALAVQPGGSAHREVNAGAVELVVTVCFEGPVEFVPAG